MVLEDREEKRDADDDDDKNDKGGVEVKIEAKLNGNDQEDGQLLLPSTESAKPAAVPIKEERQGEEDPKDSQPQGEKRKEMPSSPLKIRDDDDAAAAASSLATKRRRVESSPLRREVASTSPSPVDATTNATVGGASTSSAPRT